MPNSNFNSDINIILIKDKILDFYINYNLKELKMHLTILADKLFSIPHADEAHSMAEIINSWVHIINKMNKTEEQTAALSSVLGVLEQRVDYIVMRTTEEALAEQNNLYTVYKELELIRSEQEPTNLNLVQTKNLFSLIRELVKRLSITAVRCLMR